MADIELVIKIPERIHYGIEKGITVNGSQASQILIDAVKNGTPLPIRPKGHWIYDYTSADGHRTYHCSECGCYLKPKHSDPLNSFRWCSLCGADMREVEE